MFNIDDYWKIVKYLSGENVPELDGTLKVLADSERTKSSNLFTETIDQSCFNSEDYKRIRKFLIDWYTGFRALAAIQTRSSDPFVLPQDYLNDLIQSFGYEYPGEIISLTSRVNFFLDLVNLYKIKGTPLAVRKAVDYFGLRDTDLAEYWLQKNELNELVLRGVSLFPQYSIFRWPDVNFEQTIALDPHWMQSKQDILNLLENNAIALPSKTPYFSLRPAFNLSNVQPAISILIRNVEDQYSIWKSNGYLQKDVKLSYSNFTVSLLELYLSCVYIFNNYYGFYGTPTDSTSDIYLCYDGELQSTSDIVSLYQSLTGYPKFNADDPVGEKAYRSNLVQQFYTNFTRQPSRNFIQNPSSAGQLLQIINPTLKASLDAWISASEQNILLANLLQDLTGWIRIHIGSEFSDIISIVLGVQSFLDVKQLVNTFKPYRARMLGIQFAYIINNALFDSLRFYDPIFYVIYKITNYDWATANSLPCNVPDQPILYSRETYDCGSYHDIGIAWDTPIDMYLTQILAEPLNCHSLQSDSTNDYWFEQVIENDTTSSTQILITGDFFGFDSGMSFDCPFGNDLVIIETGVYILEADFIASILSGNSPLDVQFTGISLGIPTLTLWAFGDNNVSEEENPLNTYISPRLGGVFSNWSSSKTSPLTISFINSSSENPTSYLWDFGDGSFSTEENPIHEFHREDVYLVKLLVTNSIGNSTFEKCVSVED